MMMKNPSLEGQSSVKKGRMKAMFHFIELRWIYSLKCVSDLNWKNIAGPKTATATLFFSLNFSDFVG